MEIGGLKMYDHILNARITGHQCGFHLMAHAMSFPNRHRRINLDVQLNEQLRPAFSNKTFFDSLHARLVFRSHANGIAELWRYRTVGCIINRTFHDAECVRKDNRACRKRAQSSAISHPFPPMSAIVIPAATAAEVIASER